jgi:hypothetical protein
MISIDMKIYLKHIVTNLEDFNEPLSTNFLMLVNYSCDSDFGNFTPCSFDITLTQKSKMNFQVNILEAVEERISCQDLMLGAADKEYGGEKITRHEEVNNFFSQVWTLYFDEYKSQEGSGT